MSVEMISLTTVNDKLAALWWLQQWTDIFDDHSHCQLNDD